MMGWKTLPWNSLCEYILRSWPSLVPWITILALPQYWGISVCLSVHITQPSAWSFIHQKGAMSAIGIKGWRANQPWNPDPWHLICCDWMISARRGCWFTICPFYLCCKRLPSQRLRAGLLSDHPFGGSAVCRHHAKMASYTRKWFLTVSEWLKT